MLTCQKSSVRMNVKVSSLSLYPAGFRQVPPWPEPNEVLSESRKISTQSPVAFCENVKMLPKQVQSPDLNQTETLE